MVQSILKQAVGGRFFSVTFIKADGSIRLLNGRLGVTRHLKGSYRAKYNPYLVVVWDAQKGLYRSFDWRTVLHFKCGDLEYLRSLVPNKEYLVSVRQQLIKGV